MTTVIHDTPSPLAGKVVKIKSGIPHPRVEFGGQKIEIEDWWDRVSGQSWMFSVGNPACLIYAIRTGLGNHGVPTDDDVLYGKIGGLGHLVHVSELEIGG